MGHSIQEFLKKINSKLSLLDLIGFVVVIIFFLIFVGYVVIDRELQYGEITISTENENNQKEIRPFASLSGETYTFSWCQGASKIKESNKIYFSSEEEAKRSGKTLSKLCVR